MFQRKTKSHIKNLLQKQFLYVQEQEFDTLEDTEKLKGLHYCNTGSTYEHIMTRKTRTRRPRIHSIQSGYCAICHLPYNSIEDHINSKRHLKLIGEDANYISLNGFNLHQDNSIDSFLNLNDIETLDSNETETDQDFLAKSRKNMPRTRGSSVCKNVKPSPLSPTGSDISGHHLRSRRNINYMTPPLEEDSLPELDTSLPIENRELRVRSSARISAKSISEVDSEVWNSGRPKRSCIRQKRPSTEDRLSLQETRSYKNDSLSRRSNVEDDAPTKRQLSSPKREEFESRINKAKCKRNRELARLNTEATNFLFPKKDDASEDEEAEFANNSVDKKNNIIVNDSEDANKFKVEDEGSMDSSCSGTNSKKKRRTHAEAFINDNQKYYKFETPGSRLRYHGSLTPAISTAKSPKRNNGDIQKTVESNNCDTTEDEDEDSVTNLDNYQFSFETVPKNESWFKSFQRQDKGEISYNYFHDTYFWDSFVLPYQIGPLPPLNPKTCISHYKKILQVLNESLSASTSGGGSTPDPSASNSSNDTDVPESCNDEDSKISTTTLSSTSTMEESTEDSAMKKQPLKRKRYMPISPGKNPRKSPRQHASTLAILSSLIHQRKRKSKDKISLPTIPEETSCTKLPAKKSKNQPDYIAMAMEMENELNSCLDEDLDELELPVEETVDIHNSKVTVKDILTLYDEAVKKENVHSARRFFNGTPGRKSGRRKKKNKTGWPNKNNRRLFTRKIDQTKTTSVKDDEEEEEEVADDAISTNMESEEECEEDEEDDMNSTTDSINKTDLNLVCEKSDSCDLTNSSDRVVMENVLTNKVTNNSETDVIVVDDKIGEKVLMKARRPFTPKRTSRRQRRMPGSPKSPRILRKPRGRWYRER